MKRALALLCISTLLCFPGVSLSQQIQPDGEAAVVAQVATGKGLLNVRKQPSGSSAILDRLSGGTLVLVLEQDGEFCKISFGNKEGYAMTQFLTVVHVPAEALAYQPLQKGDAGDAVLALKQRLLELGYYRDSGTLTNEYNDTCVERVEIFERVHGLPEDGAASQTLQYLLFSDKAMANTETLPQPKKTSGFVYGDFNSPDFDWNKFVADNPGICTCCMGAGCECCNYTGKIQ